MCVCIYIYKYMFLKCIWWLSPSPSTPVNPLPEVFPWKSMSFCFVLWPTEFNGFGAILRASWAHNWRQWCPSPELLSPAGRGGALEPSQYVCCVLYSCWSLRKSLCQSKVLQAGDHVTVSTLSLRCPICCSSMFCCTWVHVQILNVSLPLPVLGLTHTELRCWKHSLKTFALTVSHLSSRPLSIGLSSGTVSWQAPSSRPGAVDSCI